MKIRNIAITLIIPPLLFACTTLKSMDKLTDKELVDKYYATDLKLYMVKRAGKDNTTDAAVGMTGKEIEYSKRELEKINKLERKLETMRQELIKRGYMP